MTDKQLIQIIDTLNAKLENSHFWMFEYAKYYNGEDEIKVIVLKNTGNDNDYRVYHNSLDDDVSNTEELMIRIEQNLKEHFEEIKNAFSIFN